MVQKAIKMCEDVVATVSSGVVIMLIERWLCRVNGQQTIFSLDLMQTTRCDKEFHLRDDLSLYQSPKKCRLDFAPTFYESVKRFKLEMNGFCREKKLTEIPSERRVSPTRDKFLPTVSLLSFRQAHAHKLSNEHRRERTSGIHQRYGSTAFLMQV